jgi:hypothetical protein
LQTAAALTAVAVFLSRPDVNPANTAIVELMDFRDGTVGCSARG